MSFSEDFAATFGKDWSSWALTTLLSSVLISVVLFGGISKCNQYLRIVLLAFQLPGPPAFPLIGNSHKIFDNDYLFHLGRRARIEYGTIVRAWASIFPVIFILEPRHIQKVLISSKHVQKLHFYRWLHTFLGKGLVTSEVNAWRKHRKLIQPSFRTSVLENYIPIINKGAKHFVDSIQFNIAQSKCDEMDVTSQVNNIVFLLLNEIVCGIPIDSRDNVTTASFRRGKLTILDRIFSPWLMIDVFYKMSQKGREDAKQKENLWECSKKMISDRKKIMEETSNSGKCLLDHFISLNFTDEECIDEVTTFMLAGQDTIAGAFTFALYCLAKFQPVQEKAVAELCEVLGDLPVHSEDLANLNYLEQCIKETLRMFPSVAAFGRTLTEDVNLDGIILPIGTEIAISPYATHRLHDYFPDPDVFDPERFNSNNSRNREPCAFIPFSAGPRNCIGKNLAIMELKILLATTLQAYHLSIPKSREALSLKYRVTIRASGGVWIKFSKR